MQHMTAAENALILLLLFIGLNTPTAAASALGVAAVVRVLLNEGSVGSAQDTLQRRCCFFLCCLRNRAHMIKEGKQVGAENQHI